MFELHQRIERQQIVGLMKQFRPKSGWFRLGRPKRQVFEAFRGVLKNVCQVACDQALGRIRLPPKGSVPRGSYSRTPKSMS